MNTSSRILVLLLAILVCQFVTEIECRKTLSIGRRGSSNRRNNSPSQSNSGRQAGFFSFGSGTKKSGVSSGSSWSSAKTKSSGMVTASQASKTSSGQMNPGFPSSNYNPSAPKQSSKYGWVVPNSRPDPSKTTTQFQKSPQPSSNIGPGGYPVQSGFHQSHAHNSASQSQGFNTAQRSNGYNSAPQPHGINTAQQSNGYNSAPQPHGINTAQQSNGYNSAPQPHNFNTGYQSPPSYNQPSYSAGHYPSNNFGQQSFASQHGISPNHYPSQSNYGYPGQGIFGGSNGPKYGGQGIFGGGTGNFGYPGGNGWGYPSYGSKSSSGKGKLLTGLALGAAGGYLTSSLVNKISNPWGYSGFGYGHGFGYDKPIIIKEIRETTKTETPTPETESDPSEKWIHCVAFDPATNQTLINPNCSCTVTTVIDPMTNQPISTHNCTTANGLVLPPQPAGVMPPVPLADPMPPNAVNNPDSSPSYGGLYAENQRYGMAPEVANATTEESASTASSDVSATESSMAVANDSPGTNDTRYTSPARMREFYTQLEQIVNMGKFL